LFQGLSNLINTMTATAISAAFPFESRFLEVLDSKMHYIDAGEGDPVLFLHGNPTSCYLWRNIIPYLTPKARCIAPDLIGMGKSGKPDIKYRFFDHYRYLNAFIEKLGLEKITLVIHDWGSGLGFHYAREHPENVRGIAFMEAIFRPMSWSDFPAGYKVGFKMMRAPFLGWGLISVGNFFLNQVMPGAIVRKLSEEEKKRYHEPYPSIESLRPVRVWPQEIPIDGKPEDVHKAVKSYSAWLRQSEVPKLLFHAEPGGLINPKSAAWIQQNFPNTRAEHIGKGLHYLQEDNPHFIGAKLAEWYDAL
jgi:haloalkane dehalogenase